MKIHNFLKFISESKSIVPVLDVIIDDDGNLYDGNKKPLMKGYVEFNSSNKIVKILGDDGRIYPGGIDKNGELIGTNIDDDGYLLNSEYQKIEFNINNNYSELLPLQGTGWVNVKIDLEVVKRVRRYSSQLGVNSQNPISTFHSKMKDFDKLTNIRSAKRVNKTVQKQMSALILLHYLKEIKNHFVPQSSGFLFESFIAGLLPNSKVVDDNSKIDILSNNKRIQVKLYGKGTSTINYIHKNGEDYSQFMILGIKYTDKITILVIDLEDENSLSHVSNFMIKNGISISQIEKNNDIKKYEIPLLGLEEKIDIISTGLKEVLDNLYTQLSEFQYNIETIISGVDEKGDVLDGPEFTQISVKAGDNIYNMKKELDVLTKKLRY
jgi:hypothetical protein